jgi:transposase-like protein
MKTYFKNLLELANNFPNELECIEFFASIRWNGKPVCPHCGSTRKIYKVNGGKLFKCADCRKQFSVKVGTIFEDSALSLRKWFMAIYLLMAHKKGISSVQLGKDISVTQRTAWFMLHRIRYAMRTQSFEKKLTGTIEADETYIGGKESNKHLDKRTGGTQGRSTKTKTAVFGIAQRDGIVAAETVDHVNQNTVKKILLDQVDSNADIMTDELNSYNGIGKHFKSHNSINHGSKEYVRGSIHTNGIEGFWAILKRGIYGIYHQVSRKHLNAYVDEFEFRFNSRKMKDSERFTLALAHLSGRLTYAGLIKM